MFLNYLKIALRNIVKYRAYSLINITALAIGIACIIVILLYVKFELEYDRYHKYGSRIYRVAKQSQKDEEIDKSANTPAPMAPALVNEFPEIMDAVRIDKPKFKLFVKSRENWIQEKDFILADPSLFKIFSFTLIRGDPHTILTDPNSIVITEKMAKKYFNKENPIGKIITFKKSYSWIMEIMGMQDRLLTHKVTGVIKEIPQNSHIKFNFVLPFTTFNKSYLTQWDSWNFATYILLREGGSAPTLENKLKEFLRIYRKRRANDIKLFLQPLEQIHLYSNIRHELEPGGSMGSLYLFSFIAFIVLLIACMNFINLSTALSIRRSREVGIRKVLGANRSRLILQFLGEAAFLSLLSLLLAIFIVRLIMPAFNTIVGRHIPFEFSELLPLMPAFFLLVAAVGLISGSYPAFIASRFQPEKVLKGIFPSGQKKRLRSTLVVAQFALSIAFVTCSIIGYQQLNFIKNKDLGFNKERIVQVPIHSRKILDSIEALKNQLLLSKNITGVSASSFSLDGNIEKTGIWWEGLPQNQEFSMYGISIDPTFIETMGIKIKEGKNPASFQEPGLILNEAAVKRIGWKSAREAVGKKIKYGIYANGLVIGVVKDFHFTSLHDRVQPLVLFNGKKFNYYSNLFVKINAKDIRPILEEIKRAWISFDPHQLFEYFFVDDIFEQLHKQDKRIQQIFQYASFLSILIACIGLFALTTLSIQQRTKEIGIRKTYGASTTNIIVMLLKEFAGFLLLANMISWPAAYFMMNKWLNNFTYRIDIGISAFILAALISLIIALFTISHRSLKAALANPVDSLRYE